MNLGPSVPHALLSYLNRGFALFPRLSILWEGLVEWLLGPCRLAVLFDGLGSKYIFFTEVVP